MTTVLVATSVGCRVFTGAKEEERELQGRPVWAIAPDRDGGCVAIVEGKEIWRRSAGGEWTSIARSDVLLASIASVGGKIFAGFMEDAGMIQISPSNVVEPVPGFDKVPGRGEWLGIGPPLHVRAVTATADGSTIMAAVHVGGIPRSTDGGLTWTPTIPIAYDVHEIRTHFSSPLVAAATAVGLCVSQDAGQTWKVFADGLELTDSLAVAVLPEEILFSIQDGPFAERSQVWRFNIQSQRMEQVREGLPLWQKGKIDTGHIAANQEQAAIVDGGGDLWLSTSSSKGWECIATDLKDAFGILLL